MKADNRTSEQGNLFGDPSHHGGFEYVPQESFGFRGNPQKVVEEEGKSVPTYVSEHKSKLVKLEQYLHDLGDRLEYERDRRHSLEQTCELTISNSWKTVRRVGTQC